MSDDARTGTVIVGGGVIGLALAYELARAGRPVRVLERERPGCGASRAAGGMLAPVSEAELETTELIELGSDSLRRYPQFVAGVESHSGSRCGYGAEGTLWTATDRDGLADLEHLYETLVEKELDVRRLEGARLRALEPHLSGRVLGGLAVPGDHQVDPRRLCRCLELALTRLGGSLVCGATVEAVESEGGRVRGVAGRHADGRAFRFEAETVVLAAGAWSEREIALPLAAFGLRPVKGQLVRLAGPRLLSHVVRTPDVYLVPRSDGELLIGATMEEMGFDTAPTGGAVMDLLRHAWEALPGIYDLRLVEVSVGLRSAVDDNLPVIGATEIGGLFVALGHYRSGVLLAPATAHYLAQAILYGVAPPELAPFAPARLVRENTHGRVEDAG